MAKLFPFIIVHPDSEQYVSSTILYIEERLQRYFAQVVNRQTTDRADTVAYPEHSLVFVIGTASYPFREALDASNFF